LTIYIYNYIRIDLLCMFKPFRGHFYNWKVFSTLDIVLDCWVKETFN